MNSLNRIVPIALCLTSALIVSGCDRGDGSAKATPVNQQGTTAALVTEPAATPVDTQSKADASKTDASDTKPTDAVKPTRPTAPTPADPAAFIVKSEPSEIDLGEIPTHDSKKGSVKLVNSGDKPMTVTSHRASCGCTTLKLVPNTVIQPKESLEIEVQMSAPARPGPIQKTVTFVVEGQPDLVVPVKGVAKSFVALEPAALEPEKEPEGRFKLTSVDGQPFRIVSATPAVLADFDKEAKAEHDLQILFDKYREVGITRQATLFLDHPKCPQIQIPVNFTPQELADAHTKIREKQQRDRESITKEQPTRAEKTPPAALDPDTVLDNLIKDGKTSEVLQRLATGLDINYRDAGGTSLLGIAAKHGNVELMKALLASKDVQIESTDNTGRTALMHAATSKNVEAVRVLLDEQANITARDAIGGTALTWAAGLGDAASVKELIGAGAEVDVVGAVTGWTPLIWAAGFGDPGSIEPLLDAHANIEIADFLQGATPLIHASRTGTVEGVNILLKRGANIENPDRNGNTPLLSAAGTAGGTADKVKALLDAGANIHAKDNRGLNALDLAQKRTDMRAPDVIKLLEPLFPKTEGEQPAAPEPTPAEE